MPLGDSVNDPVSTRGQWDVIVVGAGIEGSATAYACIKKGLKTLLLEQFILPHTRGSSHGGTRIIRKAYDYPIYIDMAIEAYDLWADIEKESGTTLFRQTGLLQIEQEPFPQIAVSVPMFQKYKIPHAELSHAQLREKFPMFQIPADFKGCLDYGGGTLKARRALEAYQTLFRKLGGTLSDGEPVKRIIPGDTVNVITSKQTYRCRSIIVTAGPWSGTLLQDVGLKLPLKVLSVNVGYWREKTATVTLPHCVSFNHAVTCPWDENKKTLVYCLVPDDDEYPGCVKIALHSGVEVDPDRRDSVRDDEVIAKIQEFVKSFLPTVLEHSPCIREKCLYTMTPDENFILDTHPKWRNIVIGAGFSGHGFKLAPVIGKILADLATNTPPSYDLSLFKAGRFTPKSSL